MRGQYKNRKHLHNLCQHLSDFSIDAVWNFLDTSQEKSPSDGIGGTVKRVTARTSLQQPPQNDIIGYISTQMPSLKRARKFKISFLDIKLINEF